MWWLLFKYLDTSWIQALESWAVLINWTFIEYFELNIKSNSQTETIFGINAWDVLSS